MWIVSRIGFFNIIQYPEDRETDLLTVKARAMADLKNFKKLTYATNKFSKIEQSDEADYKFRMKCERQAVVSVLTELANEIDYSSTKSASTDKFPERHDMYFSVWETLYGIQCPGGST